MGQDTESKKLNWPKNSHHNLSKTGVLIEDYMSIEDFIHEVQIS